MGLNEPQRRRIEATLSLIEERLLELQVRYLSGAISNGEMIRFHNDLTDAEAKRLICLFKQAHWRIRQMREQFQLRPQERDLRRILAATFAHFWTTLHDCRTNKLKGSGPVDPQLKQTLDPAIDQLIELVEELERVILSGGGT